MTIDEALKIIKDGRIVTIIIKGNNEDETKFNQENIEALNVMVETMRKYQEQERILDKLRAEIIEMTSNRGFLACETSTIHKEINAVFDKYMVESEE